MTHAHHHEHHHAPKRFGVAFAVGAALNLGLVFAEVTFGFLSNSVALVSDGVHNLSDVLGLLLAWAGSWLATRQPSDRRTYGYRRASILAALANAALLLTATGGLIVEAVQRLFDAQSIASGTVLWVASIAIAVNLGTALLFMRGRESDINIRGAFLHLMADAAVSLGVVIAALLISKTGWLWLDPVASLGVALVVSGSGWGLMRSALDLALDAVPPGVDRSAVEDYLAGLPGVTEVHDLHI
ncbi:MAG: cation diffusion facilitator family transporter, partial [Syntrophothermus sp.]